MHHTASGRAGTKSPRDTTAFILIKIDFASRFLLFIQSASSMADKKREIIKSKRVAQCIKNNDFQQPKSPHFWEFIMGHSKVVEIG